MNKKRFDGNFSHEDTTCWVDCECGETIEEIVSDYRVTWCPKCGRGYKTEFVVWQYEPEEVKDETKRS